MKRPRHASVRHSLSHRPMDSILWLAPPTRSGINLFLKELPCQQLSYVARSVVAP